VLFLSIASSEAISPSPMLRALFSAAIRPSKVVLTRPGSLPIQVFCAGGLRVCSSCLGKTLKLEVLAEGEISFLSSCSFHRFETHSDCSNTNKTERPAIAIKYRNASGILLTSCDRFRKRCRRSRRCSRDTCSVPYSTNHWSVLWKSTH